MKLTPHDVACLSKLQIHVDTYRRWRWPLLITGILNLAVGAGMVWMGSNLVAAADKEMDYPHVAVIISFIVPMFFTSMVLAAIFIGTAIKNWNGDPVRCLLIKVISELSKGKNEN